MKKKFELYWLCFVLFLLILSLPLLKTKKIIVNLPTSNTAIITEIKNNKKTTSKTFIHKSKRFFNKKNLDENENRKNFTFSKNNI